MGTQVVGPLPNGHENGLQMGVCQLLTGMILQVLLGGGNSNIFGIFTPMLGKMNPF